MGQTLAEVLRGHGATAGTRWDSDGRTTFTMCMCGAKGWLVGRHPDLEDHLADVVAAWLGTDAGWEAAQAARRGPGEPASSEVDSRSTGDANGAQIAGNEARP